MIISYQDILASVHPDDMLKNYPLSYYIETEGQTNKPEDVAYIEARLAQVGVTLECPFCVIDGTTLADITGVTPTLMAGYCHSFKGFEFDASMIRVHASTDEDFLALVRHELCHYRQAEDGRLSTLGTTAIWEGAQWDMQSFFIKTPFDDLCLTAQVAMPWEREAYAETLRCLDPDNPSALAIQFAIRQSARYSWGAMSGEELDDCIRKECLFKIAAMLGYGYDRARDIAYGNYEPLRNERCWVKLAELLNLE